MRRRISDHDLTDDTIMPHHHLRESDGELVLYDPPLALYDEALWAALVEARTRVVDLERRVRDACIADSLDETEIELGRKLWRMLAPGGEYNADTWSRTEDALRAHAKTVERKP